MPPALTGDIEAICLWGGKILLNTPHGQKNGKYNFKQFTIIWKEFTQKNNMLLLN